MAAPYRHSGADIVFWVMLGLFAVGEYTGLLICFAGLGLALSNWLSLAVPLVVAPVGLAMLHGSANPRCGPGSQAAANPSCFDREARPPSDSLGHRTEALGVAPLIGSRRSGRGASPGQASGGPLSPQLAGSEKRPALAENGGRPDLRRGGIRTPDGRIAHTGFRDRLKLVKSPVK